MKVLGVSGSPIENSNTDRIVQTVLEATGLDYEFIKLSDLIFAPCKACLGNVPCVKCENNNDCKISGIKMIHGETATPESVGINIFEDQYEVLEKAYALGEQVAIILNANQ